MSKDPNPFKDSRWSLDDGKIGTGKQGRIEAFEAERVAAAAALDLIECRDLSFTYNLKAMSPSGFRLRAQLAADVVQACVITTEPVESSLREEIDVDLIPAAGAVADQVSGGFDPLAEITSESYSEGRIDLGQLAFELLATSLDPYPRKSGAEFAASEPTDKAALSPFAVLAPLRRK